MDATGNITREMFDRYNTIAADDARDAMQRFKGYIDRNVSANVT